MLILIIVRFSNVISLSEMMVQNYDSKSNIQNFRTEQEPWPNSSNS